jgi:hypothetical protein
LTEGNKAQGPGDPTATSFVHAEGERSISVGHDALGNVFVTGEGNDVRVTLVVADQRLLARLHPSAAATELIDNPYRGLDAFYETDATLFFGRRKLVRRAWVLFQKLQRGSGPRILAVVGASGSGKSSLVRAGLLPELAREPMAGLESPKVLVLRPGPAPLGRLSDVLNQLTGAKDAIESSLRTLSEDGRFDALHRLLANLRNGDRSRFVVVVDQFEELFTECSNAEARTAFLQNLAFAASDADHLVSVVLTLRNDFAGAVQAPVAFASAVRERRLIVQTMDRDELNEAIARPAIDLGRPWPPALVEGLVAQAEGRAGALPLLQFALKRLWPDHVAGRLEEASWSSHLIEDFLVEAAGALFETAGGCERKRAEDQRIIRRAFLAMVQLGEGTPDTRRVAHLSELVASGDDPEHVRDVLAPFTAPEARLVTASEQGGEPTYELTHEALIVSWECLRGWLGNLPDKTDGERIRADLRLHRRLSAAAADWKLGRGGLWRPPELDLLLTYLRRVDGELTADERTFAGASEKEWRDQLAHERRTQRRLRWFLRVAVAMAVVLAVATVLVLFQTQRLANNNRRLAHQMASQRMLEAQDSLNHENTAKAVQSLVAALETAPQNDPLRTSAVAALVDQIPGMPQLIADLGPTASAALSVNRGIALLRQPSGALEAWDVPGRVRIPCPRLGGGMTELERADNLRAPSISPDGRFAALILTQTLPDTSRTTRIIAWEIGKDELLVDRLFSDSDPADIPIQWGPKDLLVVSTEGLVANTREEETSLITGWRLTGLTPREPFSLKGRGFSDLGPRSDGASIIRESGRIKAFSFSKINLDRLADGTNYDDAPAEAIDWTQVGQHGSIQWHVDGSIDISSAPPQHCDSQGCGEIQQQRPHVLSTVPPWLEMSFTLNGPEVLPWSYESDRAARTRVLMSFFNEGMTWQQGPREKTLVGLTDAGEIREADLESLIQAPSRMAPQKPIAWAWSHDATELWTISANGQVFRFPTLLGVQRLSTRLSAKSLSPNAALLSRDGKLALLMSIKDSKDSALVELFSTTNSALLWSKEIAVRVDDPVTFHATFSADSKVVILEQQCKSIFFLSVKDGVQIASASVHPCREVDFVLDPVTGRPLVAFVDHDNGIALGELSDADLRTRCATHFEGFRRFSRDGSAFLIRTPSGFEIHSTDGPACGVNAEILIAPQNWRLWQAVDVAFKQAKTVRVEAEGAVLFAFAAGSWRFRHENSGQIQVEASERTVALPTLPGESSSTLWPPTYVAVSPDGRRLASISAAYNIYQPQCYSIWDIGAEAAALLSGPICYGDTPLDYDNRGEFSADGTELVTITRTEMNKKYIGPISPETWEWAKPELFATLMGFSVAIDGAVTSRLNEKDKAAILHRQLTASATSGEMLAQRVRQALDAWCGNHHCHQSP